MNAQPKVAVILVHWNTEQFLAECLDALLKQSYKNFKIILVDNNSPDKAAKQAARRWPKKITYLHTSKNRGFAGGNNFGIAHALKKGEYKYLALLNVDTVVESNWLEKLVETMEDNPAVAIATSLIMMFYRYRLFTFTAKATGLITDAHTDVLYRSLFYRSRSTQPQAIFRKGEVLVLPHRYRAGEKVYVAVPFSHKGNLIALHTTTNETVTMLERSVEIVQNMGTAFDKLYYTYRDHERFVPLSYCHPVTHPAGACGCAMIMRSTVVDQLGAFDESFVNYYEDSELSVRYRNAGYQIRLVPEARVRHYFWGSTDQEERDFAEKVRGMYLREYYGVRNRLLIIKRHHGWWQYAYALGRTFGRFSLLTLRVWENPWLATQWRAYARALFDSIIT